MSNSENKRPGTSENKLTPELLRKAWASAVNKPLTWTRDELLMLEAELVGLSKEATEKPSSAFIEAMEREIELALANRTKERLARMHEIIERARFPCQRKRGI